jgi:hypothetical protein
MRVMTGNGVTFDFGSVSVLVTGWLGAAITAAFADAVRGQAVLDAVRLSSAKRQWHEVGA